MRKYGKVDKNQQDIVDALRNAGVSVQSLSSVGAGCPDLLVGTRGKTFLVEIKNQNVPVRDQQLTKYQVAWHLSWRGSPVIVGTTFEEIIKTINNHF